MKKGYVYQHKKNNKIYLCAFDFCQQCKKKHYFFHNVKDLNDYIPSEDIDMEDYTLLGALEDIIQEWLIH